MGNSLLCVGNDRQRDVLRGRSLHGCLPLLDALKAVWDNGDDLGIATLKLVREELEVGQLGGRDLVF